MSVLRPRLRLPLVVSVLLSVLACGDSPIGPGRPQLPAPAAATLGQTLVGSDLMAAALAHPPCTKSWATASSGLWSEAAKWSPAGVPTVADVVCIEVAGTYTVTVIGSRFAASLHVVNPSATVVIAGDPAFQTDLTLGSDATNEGTVVLTSLGALGPRRAHLVLGAGGTLTNAGTFRSERGTVATGTRSLIGNLVNTGTVEINTATSFAAVNGVYTNTGDVTLAASAVLEIDGNGQRFEQEGGSLVVGPDARVAVLGTARFVYAGGAISQSSPASQIRLTNASLEVTASGGNATFHVEGASTLIAGSNLGAGHALVVEGSQGFQTDLTAQSGFTSAGTIVLTSSGPTGPRRAQLIVGGDRTFTNTGVFRSERGTVATGDRILIGSLVNEGIVEVDVPTSFIGANAAHRNGGTVRIGAGVLLEVDGHDQTFRQEGGTLELAAGGVMDVTNDARLVFAGGNTSHASPASQLRVTNAELEVTAPGGSAAFHVSGASTLIAGSNLAADHVLIVEGTQLFQTDLTAEASFGNAGTIVLTSSGALGPRRAHLILTGPATLTNSGLFRTERGTVATGTRQLNGSLVNSGTVQLDVPTSFTRPGATYTNTGTFRVGPGSRLDVEGGGQIFRQNGGTLALQADGVMDVENGARLLFAGGNTSHASPASQLRVTNAQLEVTAPDGFAAFHVSGASTLIAGSNLAEGHVLVVEGTELFQTDLTAQSSFTNAGTLVLTSSGPTGPRRAHLIVGGLGTLTNTGVFLSERGEVATGTRQLTGHLANTGTVTLSVPTTFLSANGLYVNHGTLEVPSGSSLDITGNNQTFRSDGTISGGGNLNFTNITSFFDGTAAAHVRITGGTYNPGQSPGIANLARYTQAAATVMHVELGGDTPGVGYDQTNVSGHASLDGILRVALIDGFVPCAGQTFEVLTYGSGSGFFIFHGFDLGGGHTLMPTFGPTSLVITDVGGPPCDVPPVADAGGPYVGSEGENLTLNGSGSTDAGGDALTYEWNFGDGETGFGVTPDHVYADEGTYTVTLTVRDPGGHTHTATATATIGNAPPTVSAGADATVDVGEAYALSASFSDPGVNDAPWTYRVVWGDGSPDLTGSASTEGSPIAASHVYGAPGSYTVTVRVTDDGGATHADALVVTVNEVDAPPVANTGGPYPGIEGEEIDFDGSASADPEGGLLDFAWQFGDGGTATGPTPGHTYADDGTYTVQLTVTDAGGNAHTVTTTATIENVAPTVDAGPDATIQQGGSHTVSAGFTDPGALDGPWSFVVTWPSGATSTGATGASPIVATQTFPDAGTFTITVRVTDKDGASDLDSLTLRVNAPPTAETGGPYTGDEGAGIAFDGTGSFDLESGALAYAWQFGDGGTATGATPNHAYANDGSYTVTLTVTDADGASSTVTGLALVANVAPTVDAGADATIASGETFTVSASFSDPGTADAPWEWRIDWGDGSIPSSGVAGDQGTPIGATHAFPAAGSYVVTVRVSDDDGEGTDALTLTVLQANRPPVGDAGGPYGGTEGSAIAFDGTGSSDPDGDPLTYTWHFGDGATGSGPTPTHAYADEGLYNVSLAVSDPDGDTTWVPGFATVTNVAPTVSAGPDATLTLGAPLALSAAFSDPGVDDAPWSWTIAWGDGTSAAGSSSSQAAPLSGSKTYGAAGSYTVVVTVVDEDGGVGLDSLTATVTEAPSGALAVGIDVRPAQITRTGGNGVVPVAVFSTATFDARSIDPASITLGDEIGTDAPVARRNNGTLMASHEDLNGDGRPDLMLQFDRSALIANGDLTVGPAHTLVLRGQTSGGGTVRGTDVVRVR